LEQWCRQSAPSANELIPFVPSSQQLYANERLAEWRLRGDLAGAFDVLGEAMLGCVIPRDDIDEVLAQVGMAGRAGNVIASSCALHVAQRVESSLHSSQQVEEHASAPDLIARARRALAVNPRNAIAWCDLALHHMILGNSKKAGNAIRVALALAPNNRFILRSAARYFSLIGDVDRGLQMLRSSDVAKSDPWVVAAELALSGMESSAPKLWRIAGRMAESPLMSPWNKNELLAAISTIDALGGAVRKAQRSMIAALEQPTENTVAQAEVVGQQIGKDLRQQAREVTRSAEADARESLHGQRYGIAADAAIEWSLIEPFSAEPLIFASFICAACLGDFDRAVAICEKSPSLLQGSAMLANNYAFALASNGKLDEARRALEGARRSATLPREVAAMLATEGLIALRTGQVEFGRECYERAARDLAGIDEPRSAVLALAFLAREEVRMHAPQARALIDVVRKKAKRFNVHEVDAVLGQFVADGGE
jgi:Tfp pilus assembly protein PilF